MKRCVDPSTLPPWIHQNISVTLTGCKASSPPLKRSLSSLHQSAAVLWVKNCESKIISNPSHPGHKVCELLPSGKTLGAMKIYLYIPPITHWPHSLLHCKVLLHPTFQSPAAFHICQCKYFVILIVIQIPIIISCCCWWVWLQTTNLTKTALVKLSLILVPPLFQNKSPCSKEPGVEPPVCHLCNIWNRKHQDTEATQRSACCVCYCSNENILPFPLNTASFFPGIWKGIIRTQTPQLFPEELAFWGLLVGNRWGAIAQLTHQIVIKGRSSLWINPTWRIKGPSCFYFINSLFSVLCSILPSVSSSLLPFFLFLSFCSFSPPSPTSLPLSVCCSNGTVSADLWLRGQKQRQKTPQSLHSPACCPSPVVEIQRNRKCWWEYVMIVCMCH